MEKEKSTSNHGGKRKGAGRPKGTTKPNAKKLSSYRLSEEEKLAVNNLLKELRKNKRKGCGLCE